MFKDLLKHFFHTLIEIILPSRCYGCGNPLIFRSQAFSPVCEECRTKLVPISGIRCRVCSIGLISEIDICTMCRERNYNFKYNHSIFEYRGLIKDLIYLYKSKSKMRISSVFAQYMYNVLKQMDNDIMLVPVPGSYESIKERGWDHINVMVKYIHRKYKIPVFICLKRKKGKAQKTLNFEERRKNIEGNVLYKAKEDAVRNKKIVLVDDIFTTGATASECARVLLQEGAAEVSVLTLAID
jgi:competence protein ComFC